jgi:hypothetical protein
MDKSLEEPRHTHRRSGCRPAYRNGSSDTPQASLSVRRAVFTVPELWWHGKWDYKTTAIAHQT